MTRVFILFFCATLLFSCNNEDVIIKYQHLDDVVYRINNGGKKECFYANIKQDQISDAEPDLIIDWSFDDDLAYEIWFKEQGIEVISGGGGEVTYIDTLSEFYHEEYLPLKRFELKEDQNYIEAKVEIFNGFKDEVKINKERGSQVSIECVTNNCE